MEYHASTVIDAPAEKIWRVLTDVAAYPQWDPYCDKVEGGLALGKKIKVFTKLSPGRAFPVKVTELLPNQRMVWTGGMPLGLLRGVRTFSLASAGGGQVRFTLHEVFSGPLLRLFGKAIPDMSDAFQKFASGLKVRAETV